MNKKTLLLLVVSYALTNYGYAKEEVVATFKGGEVTLTEAEANFRRFAPNTPDLQNTSFADLPADTRSEIIRGAALQKLVIAAAKKDNVQERPAIRAQIRAFEEELLQTTFLNEMADKTITEDQLQATYQKLSQELQGQEEVRLHHVVVKDQAEAQKIAKDLKSKKLSFEEAAKRYSGDTVTSARGGDTGYILLKELPESLRKELTILKTGVISKPLQTSTGWHVVRLDDRRPVKLLPYQEMVPKIRSVLVQDAIKNYLETLAKNSELEVRLPQKNSDQ